MKAFYLKFNPVLFIVWLEINITGETILPELFTCFWFGVYIIWRFMSWKSMSEIKKLGVEKGFM